jgi:oxidoreductase
MRVRVAVVGLGWAGRELWLPRLGAHDDFDLVAVVDANPATRAAFARTSGILVYPTVDSLTPADVDLAVVAVPNYLHAEVAAALLTAGVSTFLEKPVCLTSAEADSLAAAERVGRATLLAGSAARHRRDVQTLAGLIPDLGRIRHVDLAWVRARGVPQAGGWFTQRGMSGGGVLVDLGWHLLDTLAHLLGSVPFAQVIGTTSSDFVNADTDVWRANWREDEPVDAIADVEDTARGFLVRDDGISVSLWTSWASHEERDVSVIRIQGSAGTAELRCTFGFSSNRQPEPVLTLVVGGVTTRIPVPAEPIGAEYRRQLDGLAATLADPSERGRAAGEARMTVRVIEGFYSSTRPAVTGPAPIPAPAPVRAR